MDVELNKEIKNILDRIDKEGFTILKDQGALARKLGKKPMIKNQKLRFAHNRRKKETVIYK